jgi:hypothetical protein
MKRAWAGEVRNVSLLVAIGVNAERAIAIFWASARIPRRTRLAGVTHWDDQRGNPAEDIEPQRECLRPGE